MNIKHTERRRLLAYRLAARHIGKTYSYTDAEGFAHSIRCFGRYDFNPFTQQQERVPCGGMEIVFSHRGRWALRSSFSVWHINRALAAYAAQAGK